MDHTALARAQLDPRKLDDQTNLKRQPSLRSLDLASLAGGTSKPNEE